MNVQDIIHQASSKITGISDPEPEDVRLFLDCLNQAHFELWEIATDFLNPEYYTYFDANTWTPQIDLQFINGLDCKKAFLTNSFGINIEEKPFVFFESFDPLFAKRELPKYYTFVRFPKSIAVFLYPLPELEYHQPLRFQYAEHAKELTLYLDQDQIPYSPSTILKLVQGTCAKAIESNLGSSSKQDYSHYINDWERYKVNFREQCYARSYKDRTKTYRYV